MKVIGIEKVDYKSRSTGKQVTGVRLHMTTENNKVEGLEAVSEFVPDRVPCSVAVGEEVHLYYNKFKQVEEVVTIA